MIGLTGRRITACAIAAASAAAAGALVLGQTGTHPEAAARTASTAVTTALVTPVSGGADSKAAALAGPPGYTYAGWFASFTGCDLHGTVGQYLGEWSTFECLPLTEDPDDGYELWIM